MLRILVLVGVVAGLFASIPVIHERNPQWLETVLRVALRTETPRQAATPVRAEAPRRAQALLGRKVRVPSDGRGHYVADFKLNGRTVNALVDTGATYVAFNRSTARRIGLSLASSDFRYRVDTANGETAAATVTVESLQIGRIYLEDVPAVVLDDAALSKALIGMSFLERLSAFGVKDGNLLLEQ